MDLIKSPKSVISIIFEIHFALDLIKRVQKEPEKSTLRLKTSQFLPKRWKISTQIPDFSL